MAMALTYRVSLIALAFLFLAVATGPIAATARHSSSQERRIAMKLISSDSLNPSAITTDRFSQALKNSRARVALLKAKAGGFTGLYPNDVRGEVVPNKDGTYFMVNFSIGQPPVPQLATIDTSSSLLWVQCQPCIRCFSQANPIYDPSKSSTHKTLPCSSPLCFGTCDQSNNCKYTNSYDDGTSTTGLLGSETLTFESSDKAPATVLDTTFGCGYDNIGSDDQISGIMGLGPDAMSLPTKLGSKFSYCIGFIGFPDEYQPGNLVLGDGANLEGNTSPLEVYNNLYYLSMESISVGEKKLGIDPSVFQRQQQGGGVVIDSGTDLTMLTHEAFDPLSTEIRRLLDGKVERIEDPHEPSRLCYKGEIGSDLAGFPEVTLLFTGGAQLVLERWNLFEGNGPGQFCMTVFSSGQKEISVIGVKAQQNNNIGFDIAAKQIYIQPIDCRQLNSAMEL